LCRSAASGPRSVHRRGRYHNGGYGYNSWWILPDGWTGDGNTGGWVLINRSRNARIGGSY
jgi:hypothetical protein